MQEHASLQYLYIINPGSGRNDANLWEETIQAYYKDKPISFKTWLLPSPLRTSMVWEKIQELQPANVIAVGGDGTVTMLAGLLAGKDIPLGILPGGSANGMAKELGIPEDAQGALDIISKGHTRKLDSITINQKQFCLHLSDLGLNARLIKYFGEGKLRGKLGYSKVILKTLLNRKKIYASINIDQKEYNEIGYMIVIANASKYGTGAVINPEGDPGDGWLEVIIVKRLSFSALLRMLFRPGMFNPKHIEIYTGRSVEIFTTRLTDYQVDGEYLGKTNKLTAKINPGLVKLIVPSNSEN